MKRWLCIAILLLPWLASAEMTLPYKPTSRISDEDGIFDAKTRDFMSSKLKEEYSKSQISVYVVAVVKTDKNQETATANRIRDAWINDPLGVIILFNRASDKIAISLTPSAFKMMAATGRLEAVANKIDEFNEEGPSRGMPKILNLILERLHNENKGSAVAVPNESRFTIALILWPIALFLVIAGIYMFKFYRYLQNQSVFISVHPLKSEPVAPMLGSMIGGVNMAEGRF